MLDPATNGAAAVKNILVLVFLAALAWYGYGKYKAMSYSTVRSELSSTSEPSHVQLATTTPAPVLAPAPLTASDSGSAPAPVLATASASAPTPSQFACDGRTHCSAMTSCAEATYFIQHCPNTKMDGNNDGVPCERQWCN